MKRIDIVKVIFVVLDIDECKSSIKCRGDVNLVCINTRDPTTTPAKMDFMEMD